MTQTPDKLNEELRRRLHEVIDEFTEPNKGERYISELEDSILQLFTTAYAEAMNEIIGEDEPEEVTYFNSIRPVNINKWRNQLRAEQRQRLQGLLPNGKDE